MFYMDVGKCKLCGRDNVTLRFSHIIPEFAYKPVYDANHRFIDFTEDPKSGAKFVQKGVREYLLCGDCEVLLSRYENDLSDFVINFFVTKNNVNKIYGPHTLITKIKYDSIKIGILSIIYRMSVSRLPQYSGYQLGTYEDIIKDIILNNKHTDRYTFSTHISPVTRNGISYPDLIMTYEKPTTYKNHFKIQCFIMYGLLFDVMISRIDKDDIWHFFSLREKGKIILNEIELKDTNIKTGIVSRYQDADMKKLIEKLVPKK